MVIIYHFGYYSLCSGSSGLYSTALGARERRRTCHMLQVAGLNGCINTLDYCVYIPTNKSEFSLSQHTRRLRDVMTVMNATMLQAYFLNLMNTTDSNICCIQHPNSLLRIQTTMSVFHQTWKNYSCCDQHTTQFCRTLHSRQYQLPSTQ